VSYDEMTLFGPAPGAVRHDARDTSRAAALAVESMTGKGRKRVYELLKGKGADGATDPEMQNELGMSGNTQRPRRIELVAAGLVEDSGRRRDRCAVWIVVPTGTT
jgi:hypothetical protein